METYFFPVLDMLKVIDRTFGKDHVNGHVINLGHVVILDIAVSPCGSHSGFLTCIVLYNLLDIKDIIEPVSIKAFALTSLHVMLRKGHNLTNSFIGFSTPAVGLRLVFASFPVRGEQGRFY